MASMNEAVGDIASVRITDDDLDLSEKLDVDHLPPSTVLSDSLEKWKHLEDLKSDKKDELKSRIHEILQEADKWNIERGEII